MEGANGTVDRGNVGKGAFVLLNDPLKLHHLALIYHADEQEFFLTRVHSLGR